MGLLNRIVSFFDDRHLSPGGSAYDDPAINPAGLPIPGGIDFAGNPFGTDLFSHRHDHRHHDPHVRDHRSTIIARDVTTRSRSACEAGMTPCETDTGAQASIGMLDRIAVRSDLANWRMPSPWAIGLGISSAIMAFPVIKVTGSLTIAGILFVLSLVKVVWLTALMIRRAWCEHYPYLPPRWLAVAKATMGIDLIDAALERLRNPATRS